jgi:hypothetical protein
MKTRANRRCARGIALAAAVGACAHAAASPNAASLGLNFGVTRGGGGPSPTTSQIPAGGFAGVPTSAQPAGI